MTEAGDQKSVTEEKQPETERLARTIRNGTKKGEPSRERRGVHGEGEGRGEAPAKPGERPHPRATAERCARCCRRCARRGRRGTGIWPHRGLVLTLGGAAVWRLRSREAGRRKPGQSRGQRGEGGRELPRGQDAEGGRRVEGSAVVGRLKQKVFGGQGNDRVEKESRAVWQRGQPRCGVLGWESEWSQDARSGLVTGRKEGGVSRHGCRREAGLRGEGRPFSRQGASHPLS